MRPGRRNVQHCVVLAINSIDDTTFAYVPSSACGNIDFVFNVSFACAYSRLYVNIDFVLMFHQPYVEGLFVVTLKLPQTHERKLLFFKLF